MNPNAEIISYTLTKLGILEGLFYLEQEYDLYLGDNLVLRYWYINREKSMPYFVEKEGDQWVVHLSLSLSEPDFNLLNTYPQSMVGEYGHEEQEALIERHHKILINFLQLLNQYGVHDIYHLWKKMSIFTDPLSMDYFRSNPIFHPYNKKEFTNDYFEICKDIVFGSVLRCTGKGFDKAHLKWGIESLIYRMIYPLDYRDFEVEIEYNILRPTPLNPSSCFRLGRSHLGSNFIGENAQDPWRALKIHITSKSWQVYVLFWPGGNASQFLQEVVTMWLSPQNVENEIEFHFTGNSESFAWPLAQDQSKRQGFGILGHTTFICQEAKMPESDECCQCFDIKSLQERFGNEVA